MLNDFPIERFAEQDAVVKSAMRERVRFVVAIEPEMHLVEEVEASRIHKNLVSHPIRSEEYRGGKDSLEGYSDSTVLRAILWKMEIFEQLSWTIEMEGARLPRVGESGEPDRNEAILAIRQSKPRVGGDFQEKAAVATSIDELVGGRAAQGKTTEYERAGLISDGLLAIFSLFPNKLDGFKLFEPAFRDADYGGDTCQAIR